MSFGTRPTKSCGKPLTSWGCPDILLTMKLLKDIKSDREKVYPGISLNKLLNSKIKDVEGCVSTEFGEATFSISRIVLEDGTVLFVNGEHDIAYIEPMGENIPGLEQEQLEALAEEQEKE